MKGVLTAIRARAEKVLDARINAPLVCDGLHAVAGFDVASCVKDVKQFTAAQEALNVLPIALS